MPKFDSDSDSNGVDNSTQQRLTGKTTSSSALLETHLNNYCGKTITEKLIELKYVWISIGSLIVYYMMGIWYYSTVQRWNFIDCMYFITVSLAGIGYGDLVPTSDNARIFTSFYVIFGVILYYATLSIFSRSVTTRNLNNFIDFVRPSQSIQEQHTKYVIGSVAMIFLVHFVGLIAFSSSEKWTSAQTFYFVVTTMATIGYGDFVATRSSVRGFLVFYIFYCTIAYLTTLNNVLTSYEVVSQLNTSGIFREADLSHNRNFHIVDSFDINKLKYALKTFQSRHLISQEQLEFISKDYDSRPQANDVL